MKELKLGFAEQLKDKGIIKQSLFIWLKHEFVLLFFHAYIDTHHLFIDKNNLHNGNMPVSTSRFDN